jgi:hypothetical protein
MRAGVAPAAAREALAPALAEGRLHALRRSPDRYVSEAVLAALSTRAGKLLQGLLSAGGGVVGVSAAPACRGRAALGRGRRSGARLAGGSRDRGRRGAPAGQE